MAASGGAVVPDVAVDLAPQPRVALGAPLGQGLAPQTPRLKPTALEARSGSGRLSQKPYRLLGVLGLVERKVHDKSLADDCGR